MLLSLHLFAIYGMDSKKLIKNNKRQSNKLLSHIAFIYVRFIYKYFFILIAGSTRPVHLASVKYDILSR